MDEKKLIWRWLSKKGELAVACLSSVVESLGRSLGIAGRRLLRNLQIAVRGGAYTDVGDNLMIWPRVL